MKKLSFIIFLFCSLKSTTQNLVPNPSFELYNFCPSSPTSYLALQNWQIPYYQYNLLYYFNSCSAISSGFSVPNNFHGNEYANNGNAYIHMFLGGETSTPFLNLRNYIQVKLNNTLLSSKYYRIGIYYSCVDSSSYATKNFGILFSNTAVQFSNQSINLLSILPYTPQIQNTELLDNKFGWKKLEWIFKATGNENYITLGNFKPNTNSDLVLINDQIVAFAKFAAIYIDDVIVEPYNCATGLVKDTTVCNKEILNLQLPTNALASYMWQDGTVGANYNITNAGTYWVTTTAQGCVTTDTIKVKYKTATPFSLGGNRVLCNAQTLTLQVPNIYNSYLWQNGTTAPSLLVKDSGLYFVTATEGKCTYTDTAKITKVNCICDPQIPTAFTPNGDTKNDMFGPIFYCAVKNYAFTIYNRYGQVVFKTNNPAQKWDGKFNNLASPAGSYVYTLQYSLQTDDVFNEQGTVLLLE